MANSGTHDALERLLQRFLRDEMPNLTPAERAALESQFEAPAGSTFSRNGSRCAIPAATA